MSDKWTDAPSHMLRARETRERIRAAFPIGNARNERELRKLARRAAAFVPTYPPIAALEAAGLILRGIARREGVFDYRVSPAGRVWLAEHPETP